jgi:methyl-accepting chemotaxis protein PixJ
MSQSPSSKPSQTPNNNSDGERKNENIPLKTELVSSVSPQTTPSPNSRRQVDPAKAPLRQQHRRRGLNLKAKAIAWAVAIGVLPVMTLGTIAYISSQSLQKQIAQTGRTEVKLALQNELWLFGLGTGITAAVAGTIAAIAANRTLRPVLNAANRSTQMVNRLRREEITIRDRASGKDELAALETNLSLIDEQLPELLWKQEAEAERFQILMSITRRLRESRSQEEVLRLAVEEVRKALRTDRVVVFRFDYSTGEGTFVEESVAPGWPKTLWSTIHDPCFEGEYIEQYRKGRIKAIDNIYQAGLGDCHIGLLERFGVKADLIAPIIQNGHLFGLLITHQCSGPRFWQSAESDLFAQIAIQVGFALDYTEILEQLDSKFDRAQLFIDITRHIRECLAEDDILKTTVEEVRKAMRSDRVVVYSFDADWYGTVVAESVVPGIPKAIHARLRDPCFAEGYVESYQAGRVHAIDDIYKADLSECYLKQLEPFAVKANLVAPILKDGQLYGLLITHQCSAPRHWQQTEIDFFAQIAMQVGFALDQARLLQRMDSEAVQTELLSYLSRRIRDSLDEENILKTAVAEMRKAIRSDRVVVYRFNSDWSGFIAAESVISGCTHALSYRIEDPCIPESLRQEYLAGRVVATRNVFEAGFHPDHLKLMERLEIKANLVAPIVKDGELFGLLIAHQCSGVRDWQPIEIDLIAQLALQVGFALDHARVLAQVEQAYQQAEELAHQQRQQKETLLTQTTELLRNSQNAVELLSSEALTQMESVTNAYNQIKLVANLAQKIGTSVQQIDLQKQQMTRTVQFSQEAINRLSNGMSAIQETSLEAAEKVKRIDRPSRKLAEVIELLSQVASQMKLQAMNAALEAARTGEAGQEFAAIGEKVLSLARQLDGDLAEIKPLVAEIQAETQGMAAVIQTGAKKAIAESQLVSETRQVLGQIVKASAQMSALVEEVTKIAAEQSETSTSASQSVITVANLASHTSEQSMAVVEAFNKLATITHELKTKDESGEMR